MKPRIFERALHRWKPWLDSIASGRGVLRTQQPPPPLLAIREVAQKALSGLDFPPCTLFEVYWLCCIFTDYDTKGGFKFDKLILPDWFPLSFGFKAEYLSQFKGKRIYPPKVWNETDRLFWFQGTKWHKLHQKRKELSIFRITQIEISYLYYPPATQSTHLLRRGRPITTELNGRTLLD